MPEPCAPPATRRIPPVFFFNDTATTEIYTLSLHDALPIYLHGVYLASCVSGKGLAAFPGLSMVFYNHKLIPAPKALPRYLDLGLYAANDGVPFTHSSNMLNALQAALRRPSWQKRFEE